MNSQKKKDYMLLSVIFQKKQLDILIIGKFKAKKNKNFFLISKEVG